MTNNSDHFLSHPNTKRKEIQILILLFERSPRVVSLSAVALFTNGQVSENTNLFCASFGASGITKLAAFTRSAGTPPDHLGLKLEFFFFFRFGLLRHARAVPERRHLRESGAGCLPVQVSGRIFRCQLRGGGQPVRHGAVPQRRYVSHAARFRRIQLHLSARMDGAHVSNQ